MTEQNLPEDELIDVVVKVRQSRLADFYAIVAEFTKAAGEGGGAAELPQEWTEADGDLARQVWQRLSPLARTMFTILIEAQGAKVPALDLVKQLELTEASQVAGALAWPRQHARAVGRTLPVSAEVTADGTSYWLEPIIVQLFAEAADA